ncbi:hypothetical protein CON53_27595 [Bacillus cereus]|nr:hypothetical protein CON53_27595 [Bacillus cereus]PFH88498.1 hypothetical protein COI81_13325 [Bacillus cereus]PFM50337.1 hypothetical protein COJ52_27070 [Bacillus cereus]PGS20679.1 hypothetical protein COC55_27150 [Bacillus cereus]
MAVQLEIQDGSPWYLSPDIWTVSGKDPMGTPSLPVEGQPCYIWARVHNKGADPVDNATVCFYWANPAVGFDRKTANHIGTANVSLDAQEMRDVLCLSPWNPTFVNNGHECVMAEASHKDIDPLPSASQFNVPTDRHVAQRNLTVLKLSGEQDHFKMNFELHNTSRLAQTYHISFRIGELREIEPLLSHLNPDIPHYGRGSIAQVGFVAKPCPDENESTKARPVVQTKIGPGAKTGLSVVGMLRGEIALLHVVQHIGEKEVGGLSILVFRNRE